MQRINTTNKATDLFGAGKHGYRPGNPATGQNPTECSSDAFNALQEEIASVVEGAGLALNPANNAQLLAAINLLAQNLGDVRYAALAGNSVLPFNMSSLNGGQLGGFRNKIINGDMQVSQVNGSNAVPVTAGAALQYVIDQFYCYSVGGNVTAQRIAGTGSEQYRHQITGGAGVTAIGIGQRMESANTYHLAGNLAIFSVDLADSLLSTVTWTAYYATAADAFGTLAAPTRTQIATGQFTVTGAMTRYSTPAIAIPAAATTGIEIVLSVGAQVSGTLIHGKWQFEQVSAGAVSGTAFERASYADQLRWCQRYLPCFNGFATFTGVAMTATVGRCSLPFKIQTRVPVTGVVHNGFHTDSPNDLVNRSLVSSAALYISSQDVGSIQFPLGQSYSILAALNCIWAYATSQIYFTGAQL